MLWFSSHEAQSCPGFKPSVAQRTYKISVLASAAPSISRWILSPLKLSGAPRSTIRPVLLATLDRQKACLQRLSLQAGVASVAKLARIQRVHGDGLQMPVVPVPVLWFRLQWGIKEF